ncbi:CbiX/SirB N-terminal domain-containing protein [uncultured Ilyobacter sp.]|jgi:sirohydrochlorin cobaltochelatase|uniref:sirohydrochlorin chelatase n=1 Tax=uncultured Ilyobacter sp. TaxID=544433 RepID=UPI0029C0A62E|nr:CbiX/SirB N-terminal domain-containing protein [uncultured Ilyobacter sp.]
MKGILIIGHGSRIKEGNEAFEDLVKIIGEKENIPVRGAHLSLASPTIEDSVRQMYQDGIKKIIVLPYFLFGGTHIRKHIPEKLEVLKKELGDIEFILTEPLANDPLIIQALLERAEPYLD